MDKERFMLQELAAKIANLSLENAELKYYVRSLEKQIDTLRKEADDGEK